MLQLESVEPLGLVGGEQLRLALLSECHEVLCVAQARDFCLVAAFQLLQCELSNGLEHEESWLVPLLLALHQQALIDE